MVADPKAAVGLQVAIFCRTCHVQCTYQNISIGTATAFPQRNSGCPNLQPCRLRTILLSMRLLRGTRLALVQKGDCQSLHNTSAARLHPELSLTWRHERAELNSGSTVCVKYIYKVYITIRQKI